MTVHGHTLGMCYESGNNSISTHVILYNFYYPLIVTACLAARTHLCLLHGISSAWSQAMDNA